MNPLHPALLPLALGFSLFLPLRPSSAAEVPPAASTDVITLFDGKSLTGWEGDPKIWRIQDGLITGVLSTMSR